MFIVNSNTNIGHFVSAGPQRIDLCSHYVVPVPEQVVSVGTDWYVLLYRVK